MGINKKKLKYLIPIMLLLFFSSKQIIINYSTINKYHTLSKINHMLTFAVIFLLLFFIFLFNRYKLKEYVIIVCIGAIITISSFITKDLAILVFFLFVLSLKDIEFKSIVKTICFSQIACVSIILMLFNLGIIDERISTRLGVIRRSFGFGHPAFLSTFYLLIVMEIFYLYEEKIRYYHIVIVLIIAELIDKATDGRTNMYCLFLFIFLFVMKNWLSHFLNFNRVVYITNIIFLFTALFLSVYLTIRYNPLNLFDVKLNLMLSNRLYLSNYFWNNYGPSLLGQPLEFISTYEGSLTGQMALILDNFYLMSIIKYGLMMTILFLVLVLEILKRVYYYKETLLSIVILIFLVYSLISPILINLELNFAFFASIYLFKNFKHSEDIYAKKEYLGNIMRNNA